MPKAFIVEDLVQDRVRLVVTEEVGDRFRILQRNGIWLEQDRNVEPPSDVGISIPNRALEAIADGLAKHLGNALPSQAEVAVLREVLGVERDRVTGFLFAAQNILEKAAE